MAEQQIRSIRNILQHFLTTFYKNCGKWRLEGWNMFLFFCMMIRVGKVRGEEDVGEWRNEGRKEEKLGEKEKQMKEGKK